MEGFSIVDLTDAFRFALLADGKEVSREAIENYYGILLLKTKRKFQMNIYQQHPCILFLLISATDWGEPWVMKLSQMGLPWTGLMTTRTYAGPAWIFRSL